MNIVTVGSARHVAPVELRGGASRIGPCLNKQGARCSNKGFLLISTAKYLTLLDWTALRLNSRMRQCGNVDRGEMLSVARQNWVPSGRNLEFTGSNLRIASSVIGNSLFRSIQ